MIKRMIYLVLLTLFFSCKKEEIDNKSPTISILLPLQNQIFTALDTIQVRGIITDNIGITSFSISLRNSNNINVLLGISKNLSTITYNLNEQIILDDLYLTSGSYTLKMSAFDGVNQTDSYIPLTINEFPKTRNGFFVFSNSGSINQVSKLSNALIATSFSISYGDFLNGLVNSYSHEVITCPSSTGNFSSYDIAVGSENWNLFNNASGLPNFTGIDQYNHEIYVAFYNGNIRSYLNSNVPEFSGFSLVNSYARKFYVHVNNLLITEQPEISGGKIRLVSYYLASGAIKDNVELNEDVVSMFDFSANEVVLFSNASGNGKIKVYNINSNSTWQPFALNTGTISSCTELCRGIYLIAQNGNVITVNMNNFTFSTYLSAVNATIVKYDVVTNEVVVTGGNILTVYDYSTKSIKGTYTHSNIILAFDFWYNK